MAWAELCACPHAAHAGPCRPHVPVELCACPRVVELCACPRVARVASCRAVCLSPCCCACPRATCAAVPVPVPVRARAVRLSPCCRVCRSPCRASVNTRVPAMAVCRTGADGGPKRVVIAMLSASPTKASKPLPMMTAYCLFTVIGPGPADKHQESSSSGGRSLHCETAALASRHSSLASRDSRSG